MSTPLRIAELQQIAERYRSGHGLDRDEEDRAFAGLDALLDLAAAVYLAYHAAPELESARVCGDSTCDFSTCIAWRRISEVFDFTGAR